MRLIGAGSAAALVVALAAQFVFTTAGIRSLDPAASAMAAAIGASAGLALAGVSRRTPGLSRSDALACFLLGAAALVVAPLVVASKRYSDAPPGSEVLFLMSAGWGVLLVLAGLGGRPAALLRPAGAVLASAGVAGIVANWERPSSFSLFVRYRTEELFILAAGVLWALAWRRLDRAREAGVMPSAAAAAAAGGLAGTLGLALSRWQTARIGAALADPAWWLIAFASAAVAAAAYAVVAQGGLARLAGAWFAPAIAVMAVTLVEQAFMPFGIQPILIGPAMAGAVATVAGIVLVVRDEVGRTGPGRRTRPAVVVAAVAVFAAAAALALPALEAAVKATRADGSQFQASFTLLGLETVGGWLALGLALSVLALALSGRRDLPGVLALAAGVAAWPFVWSTPLHTLSSAIPSEIQVDYGSEFASIVFHALSVPAMLVAVAGAAAAAALLLGERPAVRTRSDAS